jgi:hypothetical protein
MADLRIFIQFSKEIAGALISSDLRELERNRPTTVSSA